MSDRGFDVVFPMLYVAGLIVEMRGRMKGVKCSIAMGRCSTTFELELAKKLACRTPNILGTLQKLNPYVRIKIVLHGYNKIIDTLPLHSLVHSSF
jgi:hypothetical protein